MSTIEKLKHVKELIEISINELENKKVPDLDDVITDSFYDLIKNRNLKNESFLRAIEKLHGWDKKYELSKRTLYKILSESWKLGTIYNATDINEENEFYENIFKILDETK
jgi:mevalonate kinase